jgi:hypothetical protein
VDLLWICCTIQVVGLVESCGFVVQLVVGPTAQTPLVRFVVDSLGNKLYSESTANPQQVEQTGV